MCHTVEKVCSLCDRTVSSKTELCSSAYELAYEQSWPLPPDASSTPCCVRAAVTTKEGRCSASPLQSLPRELRLQIYGHVYKPFVMEKSDSFQLTIDRGAEPPRGRDKAFLPGLLLASKQVREDALDAIFSKGVFILDPAAVAKLLAHRLRYFTAARIRHLKLVRTASEPEFGVNVLSELMLRLNLRSVTLHPSSLPMSPLLVADIAVAAGEAHAEDPDRSPLARLGDFDDISETGAVLEANIHPVTARRLAKPVTLEQHSRAVCEALKAIMVGPADMVKRLGFGQYRDGTTSWELQGKEGGLEVEPLKLRAVKW